MYVRPFVRPFVRKVITFCEEDMRGDHVPVGNGVLNDRFFRFWTFLFFLKKIVQSVHSWCGLLEVKIRFWTSFDELLANFFETLKKSFWCGLRGWKKSRNWRIWGALLGVDFMIWLGVNQCFAPLPCTVYLVLQPKVFVLLCYWSVPAWTNKHSWLQRVSPLVVFSMSTSDLSG